MRNQLLADDYFSMLSLKITLLVSPVEEAARGELCHGLAKLSSCNNNSGVRRSALKNRNPFLWNVKASLPEARSQNQVCVKGVAQNSLPNSVSTEILFHSKR